MSSEFGNYFKSLRLSTSHSRSSLANRAGISLRTVAYWESGKYEPRIVELHSALAILKATDRQTAVALSLINSPRGSRELFESANKMQKGQKVSLPVSGIGDLIRAVRIRAGLPVSHIANQIGVSASTVARWEKGQWAPAQEYVEAICEATHADPNELSAMLSWKEHVRFLTTESEDIESAERAVQVLLTEYSNSQSTGIDLAAISLLAKLWYMQRTTPIASELIAELLNHHSLWLALQGRCEEAKSYASQSMSLQSKGAAKAKETWSKAATASGISANPFCQREVQAKSGHVFQSLAEDAPLGNQKVYMHACAAFCFGQSSCVNLAKRQFDCAAHEYESTGIPTKEMAASLTHASASILIAEQKFDDALVKLTTTTSAGRFSKVVNALLIAESSIQIGDMMMADDNLAVVSELVTNQRMGYFRPQFEYLVLKSR